MADRPRPTDAESPFGLDELFFSTTDRKGHITAGNDVFARVSGYPLEAMLGKPHNLIRHPDMPRAVFAVLWDTLQAGRPIAAYVKNLASDGSYYWVMATALPAPGGYVSLRLKPASPLLDQVAPLYAELRQLERDVEGAEPRRRKEAIARSRELLASRLRELGFPTYEAFMDHALPAEVAAREAARAGEARRSGRAAAIADRRLAAAHTACSETDRYLKGLVPRLRDVEDIGRQLAAQSAFVAELGEELRTFALNARIASGRLGSNGAVLDTVAAMMRETSGHISPLMDRLSGDIRTTLDVLGDLRFRIALANLQTEMLLHVSESATSEGDAARMAGALDVLAHGLAAGTDDLFTSLGHLADGLGRIARRAEELDRDLRVLRALEVNGKIEAARLTDDGGFGTLLTAIRASVETARVRVREFAAVEAQPFRDAATAEPVVREHVRRARREVSLLAGGSAPVAVAA